MVKHNDHSNDEMVDIIEFLKLSRSLLSQIKILSALKLSDDYKKLTKESLKILADEIDKYNQEGK